MALPEMTIASRNIGDIFYTLRRDDTLNGAVPCDGREFNASDFDMDDPTNNPYSLCINDKIPNVDYTQYAAQIRSQGCCACFGIDVVNGKFKVPTIRDVYIKAGDVNTLTTYLAPGLPDISGYVQMLAVLAVLLLRQGIQMQGQIGKVVIEVCQ